MLFMSVKTLRLKRAFVKTIWRTVLCWSPCWDPACTVAKSEEFPNAGDK